MIRSNELENLKAILVYETAKLTKPKDYETLCAEPMQYP